MTSNNQTKKGISLFSGVGGDSLAIKNCGYNLVAYSEIDKIFRETHKSNFPGCQLIGNGDILKTTDDEIKSILTNNSSIDVVFAGFPCQGFSNAGQKKINDPRNTLFKEFLRVVKFTKPKFIIGENVKGLLSRKTGDGQNYIDVIKTEFEKLGYCIKYKVLKINKYNIPQSRERLFIVGIKNTVPNHANFSFPEEETNIPDLKNIVKFNMKGAIKINPEDFDMATIPSECILTDMENEETEQDTQENKPHPNLKLLAKDKDYVYNETTYERRLSFGKRESSIHGEIIDIRKPSKTIICTYARQPRLFVPLKNKNGYFLRCLLPDELKQIQGFPADYNIEGNTTQKIVQIGNAVPPPIVEKIIKKIEETLEN